ncbi:unnamed protein product [Boreogadus saida]
MNSDLDGLRRVSFSCFPVFFSSFTFTFTFSNLLFFLISSSFSSPPPHHLLFLISFSSSSSSSSSSPPRPLHRVHNFLRTGASSDVNLFPEGREPWLRPSTRGSDL